MYLACGYVLYSRSDDNDKLAQTCILHAAMSCIPVQIIMISTNLYLACGYVLYSHSDYNDKLAQTCVLHAAMFCIPIQMIMISLHKPVSCMRLCSVFPFR